MADIYRSDYGVARHVYRTLIKRAVVDFAVSADWTPAAGDVKISKDGGAAANVTNLPTAITMGNTAMWDFSLTATEMQASQIMVSVADSATKAVEDDFFVIETVGTGQGLLDHYKIADALLDRNMGTGTDSSSDSVRTPRSALRVIRNKWSITGGTVTFTKENDTTTSHTAALTTSAGASPIVASDPAA